MRHGCVGLVLLLVACGKSGGDAGPWQAFGAEMRVVAAEARPKMLAASQAPGIAEVEAVCAAWDAEGARRLQGMTPPAIRNEAADVCTVVLAEGAMQFGWAGALRIPVTVTWHTGEAKAKVDVLSCAPGGAVLGRRPLLRPFGATTGAPVAQSLDIVFPYERAGGDALAQVTIQPGGK